MTTQEEAHAHLGNAHGNLGHRHAHSGCVTESSYRQAQEIVRA